MAELKLSSAAPVDLEYGSQEPPEGVPAEYQFPTIIHSLEPDVGWRDNHAYGGTILRYTGTNAEATATLDMRTTSVMSRSTDSQTLPAYNELQVEPLWHYAPQCDGVLRVVSFGRVWNEMFFSGNFLKWGDKSRTAFKSFQCPTTITVTTSDPGGAGGDPAACRNIYIDHWWWYPDSGKVEFRYTEVQRVCDNAE